MAQTSPFLAAAGMAKLKGATPKKGRGRSCVARSKLVLKLLET